MNSNNRIAATLYSLRK